MLRSRGVAIAVAAALALPAGLAWAHADLVASVPAAGAELAEPPAQVRLTFSEKLGPGSSIKVLDSQFRDVTAGAASVDAADASVLVVALPPLAPGDYTVQYQSVDQEDGHALTGSFGFRVTGAAAGPTASPATPTVAPATPTLPPVTLPAPPPARPPWFYFLVVFVAVVGMLAFSALRRRSPPVSPPGAPDDTEGGAP
jgi:copper resistance protein C